MIKLKQLLGKEPDLNKPVRIDVEKLSQLRNPFEQAVWVKLSSPITKKEVSGALKNNFIISPATPVKKELIWDISSREDHIGRIAWFVQHYDDQYPIEIDFGVPNLGGQFEISDGNHRLAAAIYLNKPYILANVSGSIDIIKQYLYK